MKIKSRLLMDALYRVQIYDNWTTLTSKIRMLDVKRKFLEQSNHWYRFTKAVRMKDLKIKIDEMLAIQAEEDRRVAVIYKRWFVMVSGLRRNKLQF